MLDFLAKFIQFCKVEKNLSKNTICAYESDILDFIKFLKNDKIEKKINEYIVNLSRLGQKSTSINRKISSLSQFCKFLFENKYIKENPIQYTPKLKKEKTIPDFLSESEIDKICETIEKLDKKNGTRNACIAYLLFASGGRVSEVCSLKFSSFEFEKIDKKSIKPFVKLFGKGGKERVCPINQKTKKIIERYFDQIKEKSGFIFMSKQGKAISRVYVGLMLKKAARICEIDEKKVHPHAFRHSIAIKLLEGGMDIRVLQEFLGHKDISTTSIYTNINKDEVSKLVNTHHPMVNKKI